MEKIEASSCAVFPYTNIYLNFVTRTIRAVTRDGLGMCSYKCHIPYSFGKASSGLRHEVHLEHRTNKAGANVVKTWHH